jgi:hypothetical protein
VSAERASALEEAAAMLDEWAECDEAQGEDESAAANRHAARCIRALKRPDAKETCACTGCAEMVERWSRSGICYDCANEDCQHEYE